MKISLLMCAAAAALAFAAPAGAQVELGETPPPELVQAAKDDDLDAAMELLRKGADATAAEWDGTTALHWAAYNENVELARRLIREGADPNARNEYGATPLQEAAVKGNAALIQVLLDGGADVESRNLEDQTALMATARTGRVQAAQVLLDEGADPNAVESWGGQTALMWAVAQRHPQMVRLLIDAGADVNARATVRAWERHLTSEPRIKELYTAGLTPLLFAAREGCVDCARMLIEAGADVDMPDPDGVTPTMLALMNMRYDTAIVLIEAGADVNRWDRWGRTALFDAVDTEGLLNPGTRALQPLDEATALDLARLLLERGARPDMRLKLIPPERSVVGDRVSNDHILDAGATPLLRAAWGADLDMVDLLLAHGARADIANKRGATPVLAAVSNGGTRVPVKAQDAIVATLDRLLEAGATLDTANTLGQTALHLAVRQSWPDVVRYLAEKGADLNAVDARGLTLMDYASGKADSNEFGTTDVVGVLPEMQALIAELTGQPLPEAAEEAAAAAPAEGG
jgi:ankyrin repeat protein